MIHVTLIAEFGDGQRAGIRIETEHLDWLPLDLGFTIPQDAMPGAVTEVMISNEQGSFRQWVPRPWDRPTPWPRAAIAWLKACFS